MWLAGVKGEGAIEVTRPFGFSNPFETEDYGWSPFPCAVMTAVLSDTDGAKFKVTHGVHCREPLTYELQIDIKYG